MPTLLKNILKYGIILFIMSYLVYDAFNKIDEEALNGISRFDFIASYWHVGNKWLMLVSIACAISSHIVRAMRWKLVLEPIGYSNIKISNATWAVLNGYFINLFIPRGGEFSRPLSLRKTEGVPTDIGVGTVVTERIIDLIFLLVCISAVMIFQADLILGFVEQGIVIIEEKQKHHANNGFTWQQIVFFAGLVAFNLTIIWVLIFKRHLLNSLIAKAKEFGKGIWKGIILIKKLEKKGLFIIYSLLIWVFYYAMIASLLMAYEQTANVGFMGAVSIFVVGGIAMALPLPGGTGAYHVMVSFTISKLAFTSMASSMAIVTILHGIHTLLIIVLGGCSVYFISKNTKFGKQR
jgi:glycosyltransferase 2 family protein